MSSDNRPNVIKRFHKWVTSFSIEIYPHFTLSEAWCQFGNRNTCVLGREVLLLERALVAGNMKLLSCPNIKKNTELITVQVGLALSVSLTQNQCIIIFITVVVYHIS